MMRSWLAHPLTRGMDLDDPRTTALRRRIVREKVFLRRLYGEWYALIAGWVPGGPGALLELGSGAGFFAEALPGAITSDLLAAPGVDAVLDGMALPVADGSLRAVTMVNVLHHLPRPRRFLEEAARCVRPGGRVVMVEPWVTGWSRVVYRRLHHEPFDPGAAWEFAEGGPLSAANGALPWILFARDRRRLEAELSVWRVARVVPLMPLRYLVSGGVSMRDLAPGWSFGGWRLAERLMEPWMDRLAMFALVVLERTAGGAPGARR